MPKEGHDYYYIEGGFIVFTKEYHLKRGFCCKNGCRHCPWNKSDIEIEQTKQKKSDYKFNI